MQIGLIQYGSGNYRSVLNALLYVGAQVLEVTEAKQLKRCSHIVLPGVGAFAALMELLLKQAYVDVLKREVFEECKPFLGICVGLQVLASKGTEFKETAGLGYIEGTVRKLDVAEGGLRLPHIGWNSVRYTESCPLFKSIPQNEDFYFLHSYHLIPEHSDTLCAKASYGGEVNAAFWQQNIFGVQFHPERSQLNGLRLLQNFIEL